MSYQFYQLPGNPVPENAFVGGITAADGRKLRYARFTATSRPLKGTIILLQGRNECVEKYFETIRDLAGRGFGVATLDWRGQGGSDRLLADPQRGYVDSFSDYAGDLEQFFEEVVLPDCRGPFFVLGHSTGSLVALLAAPSMVNRVQRMMLCVPLLAFVGFKVSMTTMRRASAMLYALGLGGMYLGSGARPPEPTPFAANVLTTDHSRYRRNTLLYQTYPNLALGGPTVAWIRAASIAIDTVTSPEFMARVQIPTLLIAAGADEVVSTPAIEAYARRLRGASMLTIDGARHELLQEADIYREQLFGAFDAFIPGADAAVG